MEAISIYLDEVIEERRRDERRRWIKRMVWLVLIALVAVGATYRPPADPIVLIEPRIVKVPYFVRVPIRVVEKVPAPQQIITETELLPPGNALPQSAPGTLFDSPGGQICLSPKRVFFTRSSHLSLQPVIVSNMSSGAVTIKRVRASTWQKSSGFSVDAKECEGVTLAAGARCTINVGIDTKVFDGSGDTVTLLVSHDAPGELETMTIYATAVSRY